MTRFHVQYQDDPNLPPTTYPFTSEEEMQADAAALTAESPINNPLKPAQFFSMMDIAGLTDKVNAAIAAIPDPTQQIIARNKLAHTDVFTRDNPLFETLKAAVGVTDAQIDAMWMQAKDI